MRGAAKDEPRFAVAEVSALRLHPPAPFHLQVAAQRESAFESQEQVLANGVDRLEQSAVESRRDPLGRRHRMRSVNGDALADEHLEPLRGAVERIAFGHADSVCPSWPSDAG